MRRPHFSRDIFACMQFGNVFWKLLFFTSQNLWRDNSYIPNPGDIIFFDWDDEDGLNGQPDHVGIVEKVENGYVYTIEGNSGDRVVENAWCIGYYEILEYAA